MVASGLSACGSSNQRVMFSGVIGIWSPASVGRSTTLVRFGPATPVAPGTPANVWQPLQPLVRRSCSPTPGCPGIPGAGVRTGTGATVATGGPGWGGAAEQAMVITLQATRLARYQRIALVPRMGGGHSRPIDHAHNCLWHHGV